MNTKNAFAYLTGEKKYDTAQGAALSQQGAQEGIVLLKNDHGALPLCADTKVAFFGRMQKEYLILGTGSGGRVHPTQTTDIFSSLRALGCQLDEEVESFYDAYVEANPYDGKGAWSHPASQTEPLLDDAFVASAAVRNTTALVVITRTAGEDCDLKNVRGGFCLTETEIQNLGTVRKHFGKVVVLLNVCGIIEFADLIETDPDAIVMLWQGGMMGGLAAANVLMGKVNPSGKLPDTIAYRRADYPAAGNYGETERNYYKEDIYVGYRYFETFAKDTVLYPFGHGLSYTSFETKASLAPVGEHDEGLTVNATVTNTGRYAGKHVVQCYVSAPNGTLGKPFRVLCGFAKTALLAPGESETLAISFSVRNFASYDDKNYEWVLEEGNYTVYAGDNVRDAVEIASMYIDTYSVLSRHESALAPVLPFDRMVNKDGRAVYEPVPTRVQNAEPVPAELPQIAKDGMTLADVADGKITVQELVSRMTDKDLIHIVRAEGMSSPKVTPGTAAAFVGVTPSLTAMGLPTLCCTDGPSGIRMVSDETCVCYPDATCLAATWNTALIREMYFSCGCELASYHVDILLGPGTNIHRDPLCGRNFEYFSEDPLLAGKMAAAVCNGLDDAGVSGAVKHYLANNQERNRHGVDAVLSERAVREIYARPFEICVRESGIRSVMTSYNPVNGRWAASNYDLTVRLLRNDYGFTGFVMTDWWAKVSDLDGKGCATNLAGMVHAMNDIYMVCPDSTTRDDNLESALADGTLSRGELQACAVNLLNFALDSLSYMAMRAGYGKRDLKTECDGKEPAMSAEVIDGKATVWSGVARKAILRASFVSDTPALTQTSIMLNVSTKNAGGFIVGGTGGGVFSDYREIALLGGDNEFVFTSDDPLAKAVLIELF